MMFVGELLVIGERVWLISPWISNVVIIDNRSGSYDVLNPEWGRTEIRLVEVLNSLMIRGVQVVVVTCDIEENRAFIKSMKDSVDLHSLESFLTVKYKEKLHTKGILLAKCLLMGSMNITYNGIEIKDESIQFSVDPEDLAITRLQFETYLR